MGETWLRQFSYFSQRFNTSSLVFLWRMGNIGLRFEHFSATLIALPSVRLKPPCSSRFFYVKIFNFKNFILRMQNPAIPHQQTKNPPNLQNIFGSKWRCLALLHATQNSKKRKPNFHPMTNKLAVT